ncbi:hypothetical protein HF264_19660 [Rhizobium leguminosarum]|uniref:hypothetical protein n=1 Tax=Rhizobium leguminosarum TaxID=384 RepID=UPI001C921353|nr:hypothetical protein [Rhizobium leguminosarum]MBY2941886.1 hypothetical protein [Rhizobium leguminosarum]
MKKPWTPAGGNSDGEHPHHTQHHPHHRGHHRPTIHVGGKLHVPPHVDTHEGIAHISEQLVELDDKVDRLTALLEQLAKIPSAQHDRPSASN